MMALARAWLALVVALLAEGIRRRTEPRRWGRSEFGDRYPPRLCAEQWVASDEVVSRDLASVEHALHVTYEDLADSPVALMRTITDFLGLAALPAEAILREGRIHGVTSPIVNMNGGSLARLSAPEKGEIADVATPTLRKYGYL